MNPFISLFLHKPSTLKMAYRFLLQIETVGPEGDKLLWVLLIMLLAGAFVFYWQRFSQLFGNKQILLQVEKNKVIHPTTLFFKVENRGNKAIDIEQPVIRFSNTLNEKAYKIKGVNASAIYPLFLEPGKSHELVVALQPFYDHTPTLQNFLRVRIEISYQGKKVKSSYLRLKPGLFRSAKAST